MTRLAILYAVLLAGCVASPEQEEQVRDGFDAWQEGAMCVHLYERRANFDLADSGATCSDGAQPQPMGHMRRRVGENCGESLAPVDYRAIWGCYKRDQTPQTPI